jgi:leucine-zipper of insertion element IS481
MRVRMAAGLPGGVGDAAAFCRAQGISRQTYYKWRQRFEREGMDGLRERSRRPGSSPATTAVEVEEAIVRARKQLAGGRGGFNGPHSIADRLAAEGVYRRCRRGPPSRASWPAVARAGRSPRGASG